MLLVFIKFPQSISSSLYLCIAWLIDCILFIFIGLFRHIYIFAAFFFFLRSLQRNVLIERLACCFFFPPQSTSEVVQPLTCEAENRQDILCWVRVAVFLPERIIWNIRYEGERQWLTWIALEKKKLLQQNTHVLPGFYLPVGHFSLCLSTFCPQLRIASLPRASET